MKNKYIQLLLAFSSVTLQGEYSINNKKENISIVELRKCDDVQIHALLEEAETVQYVLELSHGTVINEGGILTRDGYILEDTQTSLLDQHGLKKKNRDLNSENFLFFRGRLAVISSPGSENWYHWLLQVLPRLIILAESGISYDRIYVNNLSRDWQINSLHIVLHFLDIPKEKLFTLNGDCIVQASTLIVPSVPFIPIKNTPMPAWLQEKIRTIFLDKNNAYTTYEKIYISRSNAAIRQVANELELTKELQKIGFAIVHLEDISSYEQAHLFNKAKMIVGPHGSGFANLIFSDAGCILVELDHGVNPSRSFYKRFAEIMKSHYFPFYVDDTTEDHLEEDMVVDVQAFLDFLAHVEYTIEK